MNKEYYVYCATGVNGEILYIGKGDTIRINPEVYDIIESLETQQNKENYETTS